MRRMLLMLGCLAVTAAYAEEVEPPSMEFLEFMGEWEGTDGQWQDPMQLVDMDDAALQQPQTATAPVSAVVKDEVKEDEK